MAAPGAGATIAGTAARPAAELSATYATRGDGRVVVRVTTEATRVVVRYRISGHRQRVVRIVRNSATRAVLSAGARRIMVMGSATARLASSGWVAATPAPVVGTVDLGDGSASVSDAELATAASAAVLFGHQSVGMNVIDSVPALYDRRGAPAPPVLEWPATRSSGGFLTHRYIGENGDPMGKIADFASTVRGATGIQVAVMKLCFVDIVAGTDTAAVFARYRDAMADLTRDRPSVRLVYATVPLTVGSSVDNAARQRYNALIRREYGATGRLFDIAAIESTRPDGSRVTGAGGRYLSLHQGYASDDGHLNEAGAQRAAAGLMRAVAAAHQ